MTDTNDLIDRLAAYRPEPGQFAGEWNPARARAEALAAPPSRRVHWLPRVPVSAPIVSAAAVAALLVGVVAVVGLPADSTRQPATGTPFVPASIVATPRVEAGQFSYRATAAYSLIDGAMVRVATYRTWSAPDGSEYYQDTDSSPSDPATLRGTSCGHRPASDTADFESPDQAFFDSMPTTAGALEPWMRARVQGSTSQDEALFVAVGDALRDADLLASSQVRAALVTVVSALDRVAVHAGASDASGRAAVRLDFVDQANRPGEVESMYFDPSTFQLLEESDGANGAPVTYDWPSPAYLGHGTPAVSSDSTPTYYQVSTDDAVVDAVPADVLTCAGSN